MTAQVLFFLCFFLKRPAPLSDMASGDFTNLARKTAYDKALHDEVFEIGSNPQY